MWREFWKWIAVIGFSIVNVFHCTELYMLKMVKIINFILRIFYYNKTEVNGDYKHL